MNILFSNVGLFDAPNAAFLRTYYFARELAKLGHNVTLLTTQRKGYSFPYKKIHRDNITIIVIPSISPLKIRKFGYGFLSIIIRILYALGRKFDIVHSDNHRPSSSFPAYIHSVFRRSKYIAEWWDYFGKTGQYDNKNIIWKLTIGGFDNYLEKRTIKKANGAVVLSQLLKERALKLGHTNESIDIVWGGSDISTISFVPSNETYRNKFNLDKNKFLFISTGIGGDEILEYAPFFHALNKLYDKRKDFAFARTGHPISTKTLEKLNMGEYFNEIGFIKYEDYQYFLSCADIFVLIQTDNNKNKGRWPNCTGDYLAAGRPLLFNIVGDLLDFSARHSDACEILDINDTDNIEKNINDIIEKKSQLNKKFAEIRNVAKNSFSWKKRAMQLEKFYKKIITNNGK